MKNEIISGVYCIENIINHKKYIGKSKNCLKRIMGHKSSLRGGYDGNLYLQRAWDKYGEDNFDFYILSECVNNTALLNKLEIFYINYYDTTDRKNGYNITRGGDGGLGIKHTEEQRIAQSLRVRGENHPLYGVPVSQETRNKISESHKGKRGHPQSKKNKEQLFLKTAGIKKVKNTSSKYVGVSYNKRNYSWTAQIGYLGKILYLGSFQYEYKAAQAYNEKAIELYGENFPINIILENDINHPKKNTRPKNIKFDNLYRGVSKDKNGYGFDSYIRKDNIRYYLGHFENPLEAAIAYNEAAIEFYGYRAKINIITEEEYNNTMVNL